VQTAPQATPPVAVQPASESSVPAAPVQAPVEAPAAEPVVQTPAVAAAPVAPAPAPVVPASAQQPIVVPAVAPAAKAQALHDVVNAAGLKWVETDPERHAQTQQRIAASYAPVRLGRERKPVTPISNEPLVQVETRH